jgi:hypothetical protein
MEILDSNVKYKVLDFCFSILYTISVYNIRIPYTKDLCIFRKVYKGHLAVGIVKHDKPINVPRGTTTLSRSNILYF